MNDHEFLERSADAIRRLRIEILCDADLTATRGKDAEQEFLLALAAMAQAESFMNLASVHARRGPHGNP